MNTIVEGFFGIIGLLGMTAVILAGTYTICGWLMGRKHSRPSAHFEWTVGPVTNKNQTTKGNTVLNVKITNEEKVLVSINPKSKLRKAAKVDPNIKPSWDIQSGDSAVDVAPDGMSALFTSSDTPGDTIVSVSADADLGEGVATIIDTVTLTVEGAMAESLGLTAGKPEPK